MTKKKTPAKKKTTAPALPPLKSALAAGLKGLSGKLAAGKVTPQVPAPAGSTPLGLPATGKGRSSVTAGAPVVKGEPSSTKQETAAPAAPALTSSAGTAKADATKYPAPALVVDDGGKGKGKKKGKGTAPAAPAAPAGVSASVTVVPETPAKAQDAPPKADPAPAAPVLAPVTLKSLEAALDAGYKLVDKILGDYEKAVRATLKLEIQIEALTEAPVIVK